jgi:hypothetical protein
MKKYSYFALEELFGGSQKTSQKVGLKRDLIDKYYTKPEIVDQCLNYLEGILHLDKDDLVIEPSAGSGNFSDKLEILCQKKGCTVLALDLKPEKVSIKQQDYLLFDPSEITSNFNRIHVVGNPPFGRNSKLAKDFIKKSATYCNTISFVLPKSFKKNTFKRAYPIYFHQIFEWDLPKDSFLVNGVPYDVPCVFQVWEKRQTPRILPKKHKPEGYIFVKKNANPPPHVAFRRVGVYAGRISEQIEDKNTNTHYYIRFGNDLLDNPQFNITNFLINKYKPKELFTESNTAGPRSISQQELIPKLNTLLKS